MPCFWAGIGCTGVISASYRWNSRQNHPSGARPPARLQYSLASWCRAQQLWLFHHVQSVLAATGCRLREIGLRLHHVKAVEHITRKSFASAGVRTCSMTAPWPSSAWAAALTVAATSGSIGPNPGRRASQPRSADATVSARSNRRSGRQPERAIHQIPYRRSSSLRPDCTSSIAIGSGVPGSWRRAGFESIA